MQRPHYRQIALRPLGAEDATELMRVLLGADPSLAPLTATIIERTGGNPFFIEEVVRSLEETGAVAGARGAQRLARLMDTLAVPGTVHAVLAARIDRLGEREKEVLQTAAVIGREFREGLLARVVARSRDELAAALSALAEGEYVYESALHPELEYAFVHPLTREVAYGSQLADRRAPVHAAAAQALEEGDASKLDERAATLAHHWEAAGEPLAAARWHRRAAMWAVRTDFAEARRHWEQVRTLARRLPETREQAELGAAACAQLLYLASRQGCAEDEATAIFEEGKRWGEASHDVRLQSLILAGFSRFRGLCLGDGPGCVAFAEAALQVATEAGDREARLVAQPLLSAFLYLVGRPRDALAMAESAVELAAGDTAAGADVFGYSPYILALIQRGQGRQALGYIEDGRCDVEQSLKLALAEPSVDLLGSAHLFAVNIAFASGDGAACAHHALALLDIGAKVGSHLWEVTGLFSLGCAHLLGGSWSEAATALERARETVRSRQTGALFEAHILELLAEAYLGAGETSRARAAVDEAIALAEKRGTAGWGYRGPLTLARVLLASSGSSARPAIEAALAAAQTRVDESGERIHQPHIHLVRAELAAALGDAVGRTRELREAHRLFIEMGAPLRAERVARELG
jgi:adenylate cyclase